MSEQISPELERSERITMLTDFVLAAVAGGLALPLLSAPRDDPRPFIVAWGLVFAFTALGAIAGGLFHGTRYRISAAAAARLWRITLVLTAPIGSLLLSAAALQTLTGSVRIVLLVPVALKLVAVLWVITRSTHFAVVAYDAGISLVLVGALVGWGMVNGRIGAEGGWLLTGVALSLAGAVVQQRGLGAGRPFDHNDLFHLAQAAACWLFYHGAIAG